MSHPQAPLTTPLQLLQQLAGNLLEHFDQACAEALENTEQLLAKLERQRARTQERLYKANTRLSDAVHAGKAGRQAKYRARITELDELLATLESRHAELLEYLQQLRLDVRESLELAQGIGKIAQAAASRLTHRALSRAACSAGQGESPAAVAPPAPHAASATGSRGALPQAVHTAAEPEAATAPRRGRPRKAKPPQA
ncbi:AlgP family protein [Pseudomonas sp. NW5]|uniref:AlgP family protein n=1 Tax=Pseudomonas sp. NW5 TaxID=2934934 RepID=UPI00202102C7|nr:AlgP family protein [Pseudomonas sp. NW5]MCL7462724.1 AlgP family protein [Pseudomonas sp. NW5]